MFALTLGPSQIVILLLIGILLFGTRLPEMGRVLARTVREFQNGWRGIEDQIGEAITSPAPTATGARLPPRVSVGLPAMDAPGKNGPVA